MASYLTETKLNLEEKIARDDEDNMSESVENEPLERNFIIDNFKSTRSTLNVVLAQREVDLQKVMALSIKNEKLKADIDKLDTQKYQVCLDNANLRIEISEGKDLHVRTIASHTHDIRKLAERMKDKREKFIYRVFIFNFIVLAFTIANLFGAYEHSTDV